MHCVVGRAIEASRSLSNKEMRQATIVMTRTLFLFATVLAVFLQCPSTAHCIVLCDVDCIGRTDVDVCRENSSFTPLPIMALFPCEVPSFRARGLTVAAQMAVRKLQRNATVLPDYSLELIFSNAMCSGLVGVREFINQLLDGKQRYMIIGPGCSTGTIRIAGIAPFWNLTQISYAATSITLSDKRRFPNFLRTIPSDIASVVAFRAIIREYDWEQVAIVTQINEVFSNLTSVISHELEDDGVRVITERLSFKGGVDDTRGVVWQLSISGARIVILNVYEDLAREVFCVAYKRGMRHPEYLFLSHYWYTEFWWRDNIARGENYRYEPEFCDQFELMAAIDRSLAPDFFPSALPEEVNQTTDVGYTTNEFWREYINNTDALGYPRTDAIRQGLYAYDAVWAAGFALDAAIRELENETMITDFDYSRGDINRLILRAAQELDFRGVSGRVTFNEFGDREPTLQFFQYRFEDPQDASATVPHAFGHLDPTTGRFYYSEGEGEETVFPDGVPKAAERVYIDPALFGFYTALSFLGIVFAVVCLLFNLIFRQKKIVKLSSPYLNVLIITGAILFYVDVILQGVDENVASHDTVDGLCQARIWIGSIGFSLFFGTMLAKTWRVYYIFRSVKLKKKPMKDWMLFLMVAVLVTFDLIFLSIVTIWRLKLVEELKPRKGGEIPQMFAICDSDEAHYWIPVLLCYKSVFLLVGVFLAAQTYNVKVKEIRDSKLIVASVCGIAVSSIVLGLVVFLIEDNPDATYGVTGMFVLLLITAILVLLFVTRMIELWKNPSGEIQLTSSSYAHQSGTGGSKDQTLNTEDAAKIAQLKRSIDQLKREIEMVKSNQDSVNDSSQAMLLPVLSPRPDDPLPDFSPLEGRGEEKGLEFTEEKGHGVNEEGCSDAGIEGGQEGWSAEEDVSKREWPKEEN